jgi:hypothetical protein
MRRAGGDRSGYRNGPLIGLRSVRNQAGHTLTTAAPLLPAYTSSTMALNSSKGIAVSVSVVPAPNV